MLPAGTAGVGHSNEETWRNASSLGEAVIYVAVVHTKRQQSIQNGQINGEIARSLTISFPYNARQDINIIFLFSILNRSIIYKIQNLQLKFYALRSKIILLRECCSFVLFIHCLFRLFSQEARETRRRSLTIVKIVNEGK